MSKSGLIRKTRLISKFMTSQAFEQTIAIHILTKISRSKGNQAIFGQLIEYNMRNIFFQNLYRHVIGHTIPRSLSKKVEIEHISGLIV